MRGRNFSLNPLEEERGFHQSRVDLPLLKEDIPPDEEGWLCSGYDCKDAAATSGEKLDDISRLPSDDSKNGLPDIPCPNEVSAKHLGEEISSLENDLVLLGNNSVQRKEMSGAANADKLSELELENDCDEQRENDTQSDELPLPSNSQLSQVVHITSKYRSSGKRKTYGEVTTKRLCKSFKENNYPDCDAKEKFEQSGGWIKALPEEVENERMHLMTMVELVQPKWYERLLAIAVQEVFFNFYFVLYLLFPKLAHRVVGHLEEEAIHLYTLYLNDIDRGEIENVPAPIIAIDY
ncbi:Ubiquinol oxidase 1, mitochondrial [Capsicum annuum]|uniref:Ubiquinol oxidase n=1 Tax=Capsicum annuum TaxID=4072 RepID=A0A2G3AL47_CAPAN|nr:Ubiquinol oxidase 1, mitochondrial [Capsicum annuum]KAF3681033.1 Ubiquinol oxidase 1, mitochondrial [Capsicum annuum]PHT94954.1 Ubiquinol oxidase 1, mitochondrial [Capsicum annuum]